ncbi:MULTISPECIES: hypothetical protein [Xanthomonas]|uniref:hypothetical protein n=1 Tax=Xanthomonas TaxID=338 RepID=UPI001ADC169F|nr:MULTISPECIES: hypothetical protein [unclassified Xanthomonas]MBO9872819.1 hypothetical protein [Xanthomonas sp. D-93]WNH44961.1 hypothetical protein PG878_00310 [Xanthomonas sp. A6251]
MDVGDKGIHIRDPERIDGVLAGVKEAWQRDPDLRLGQLMMIVVKPELPCREMFYIEDDALLWCLRNDADVRRVASKRRRDEMLTLRCAVSEALHHI